MLSRLREDIRAVFARDPAAGGSQHSSHYPGFTQFLHRCAYGCGHERGPFRDVSFLTREGFRGGRSRLSERVSRLEERLSPDGDDGDGHDRRCMKRVPIGPSPARTISSATRFIYKETDLFCCTSGDLRKPIEERVLYYRNQLDGYVRRRPEFLEEPRPYRFRSIRAENREGDDYGRPPRSASVRWPVWPGPSRSSSAGMSIV